MLKGTDSAKLYNACRVFCLKILQQEFTAGDLKNIKELSIKLIDLFLELGKVVRPDLKVTCKLHQMMHIADNIQMFGPPIHHMTFRHERKHQSAKQIVRATQNYNVSDCLLVPFHIFLNINQHIFCLLSSQNLGKTILSRQNAAIEAKAADSKPLEVKKRWPKNKKILKRLKNEPGVYIEANKFKDNTVIGAIYEEEAQPNVSTRTISRNDTGYIRLKKITDHRVVVLDNVEDSFDFIFTIENNFYKLEWPLY